MAQPKRNRAARNPQQQELDNLQVRSDSFVQKRNELNDQGRVAREERDLLNDQKKGIFDKMNAVRDERDRFNKMLREAKERRNEFQAQAKELIRRKHGSREKGKRARSAPLRMRELQHQIRELTYKQETSVLTSKEEQRVVKAIRTKALEVSALEPEVAKAAKLKIDLSDTEKAIDTLFAQADEEHKQVVAFYKSSQAQHEKYVELVKEVGRVIAEANAKHAQFVEIRKKADEQHEKMLELRSKILEIRGEAASERAAARKEVRQRRDQVRKAVLDPKALDAAAEDALSQLKKGGKIQFG